MKVHANAPLGPKGREIMVVRVLERGWSLAAAAAAAGVSERHHFEPWVTGVSLMSLDALDEQVAEHEELRPFGL